MECIFCKIINGDIPSYTIYEDDIVKCFLDINPKSVGHTLIIPKKHYKDIFNVDNETLLHMKEVAKTIYKKIEDNFESSGFTLMQNNGDPQEVKHFHIHIQPYYKVNKQMDIEEVFNKLK